MKPVTGSKKYYGVTSKKSRMGVMDQTLTITDFFEADYALTPLRPYAHYVYFFKVK